QLEETAQLNEHVKVLAFQRQDTDVPTGTECEVAGWGEMNHNGKLPDKLQQVERPVISRETCNERSHPPPAPRTRQHKLRAVRTSSRTADSGGPLVCNGIAEGVVSAGSRVCGNYKKPGIYTRIAPYVDWIDSVMAAA
uniref:Complement factor D n=1 Tax=Pelodiscus sinensis TaxID=13735 RepID=K7GA97_PELSI